MAYSEHWPVYLVLHNSDFDIPVSVIRRTVVIIIAANRLNLSRVHISHRPNWTALDRVRCSDATVVIYCRLTCRRRRVVRLRRTSSACRPPSRRRSTSTRCRRSSPTTPSVYWNARRRRVSGGTATWTRSPLVLCPARQSSAASTTTY